MMTPPDLYCVIGNPVEHSRSPAIHTQFAALTGQHLSYERRLVALDDFGPAIRQWRAQGGKGCNITVPFKVEAAQIADLRSARVVLAGAANTLIWQSDGSLLADNTDGLGLVADITRNAGIELAGRDIVLIGAGGAGAGVLGPLLQTRPRRITVTNRTPERARQLVDSHQALAAQENVTLNCEDIHALSGNFDIVINATASSLTGGGIPVPASILRPGCLAYDMMYGPAAQPFLNWATEHGAQARDGLGMLVEQAAEAFALWRGIRPPSGQVLAQLHATLYPSACVPG